MAYIEKDLQLFPNTGISVLRFDEPHTHGLTSYDMKAVDYIITYEDKYVFLELKDPDDPNARTKSREKFFSEFKSDTLKTSLSKKYRDSFIYRWAQNRIDKPIFYYVIVCARTLKPADYLTLTDKLKKYLVQKHEGVWVRKLAEKCLVVPLTTWNQHFPDCIIRRRSLMGNSN